MGYTKSSDTNLWLEFSKNMKTCTFSQVFVREYAFGVFFFIYELHKSNICRCLSMRVYTILKCLAKRNMHHVPKVKGPNNTVHVFLFFFILLNFNKANILHNYSIYLYSRITSMYFKQTLIYYY